MPIETIAPPTEDEFEALCKGQRPVVIKGVIEHWPAFERWNLDYLRDKLAHRQIQVSETMTGEHRLHVSYPRRISGAELLDAFDSPDRAQRERYHLTQVRVLDQTPGLLEDIAWPSFLKIGKLFQVCLWMAAKGTRTCLHWDGLPALLSLVTGEKDFWLIPPEEHESLYPNPLSDFPFINRSQVDCFAPELDRFPRYAEVEAEHVHLSAGDMLFVPPFWWHYVKNLDTAAALRFEFDGIDSDIPFYNERRQLVASGRNEGAARPGAQVVGG